MKKNLFLAIFSILFSTLAWGQLQVLVPGASHITPNGDTVKVAGDDTDLYIINSGLVSVTVLARRDSLNLPMVDTDNDFCWGGFCYGVTTNVSSLSQVINPGDTANTSLSEFQGHYFPDGHPGKAFIRYDFFNKNNPSSNDSAWVVVEYNMAPAGVKNISANAISFRAPYPNPGSNFVNFNYSFTNGVQSADVKIFNLLGECVQTVPLSPLKNKTTIDVQAMPSGIYVCEVEANGCQPAYQKLIVSH